MVIPAPSEHPFKPATPHRGLFFVCDLTVQLFPPMVAVRHEW
jgi:hypothetical protein